MNKRAIDILWFSIIAAIGVFLLSKHGRDIFTLATVRHPIMMGFCKFAILAVMGEMLAMRLIKGGWTFKGACWPEKMLVWGCLGVSITVAFTIFNAGAEALVFAGVFPAPEEPQAKMIVLAFYKSFLMNAIFGFPMMLAHRVTDMLIERRLLWGRWPFMQVWKEIDWDTMWGKAGFSLLWFWLPAHTLTFCLPSQYRILAAAMLSICLGIILAAAKSSKPAPPSI